MLVLFACVLTVGGKTLVVDQRGGADFKKIGIAVSLAGPGDQIEIHPGIYKEGNMTIDETLALVGEGEVTVKGAGGTVILVEAPGCTISNLIVEGSGGEPAVILETPDNLIRGCHLRDGSVGVRVLASNNTLRDNLIESGVEVDGCTGCRVINNTFRGDEGVVLVDAEENTIQNCTFLSLRGVEIIEGRDNLIERNSFNCPSGALFIERSEENQILGNVVVGKGSGMVLSGSSSNLVADNNLTGCYVGLDLVGSWLNTARENEVGGCKVGIRLKDGEGNSILQNRLEGNEIVGVFLENSSKNEVGSNLLVDNGDGLLLKHSSTDNLVRNNTALYNRYGISLLGSGQNRIRENWMEDNLYNVRVERGSDLLDFSAFLQDVDASNTAGGKPIIYLVGERDIMVEDCGFLALVGCENVSASGLTISNSSAGILLVNSSRCRVVNCTLTQDDMGVSLMKTEGCSIEKNEADNCDTGFGLLSCRGDTLLSNGAENCSATGFQVENSTGIELVDLNSSGNRVGISILDSASCMIRGSRASGNDETGIRLIGSDRCILNGNRVTLNDDGMTLSGSYNCYVLKNNVSSNEGSGIELVHLSGGTVNGNLVLKNKAGIFLQSVQRVHLEGNNLSLNDGYGLRMSYSGDCKVLENELFRNGIGGASLIDCSGNSVYHNSFVDNGNLMLPQNAADNGENSWYRDLPVGGNFWSDHRVVGNPGTVPKEIPSRGTDRYPFQDPGGWKKEVGS
ncbi:MAG: right-handed parallel beta-helix repeat-containing protein [Methanotrichaceae archaeon]